MGKATTNTTTNNNNIMNNHHQRNHPHMETGDNMMTLGKTRQERGLSAKAISRIGTWFTPSQRVKMMDLDRSWHVGMMKYFFETLDDYWVGLERERGIKYLKEYGGEVFDIILTSPPNLERLEEIFKYCHRAIYLSIDYGPVNEILHLAYEYYRNQLEDLLLTPKEGEFNQLAQLPNFPNLNRLKCQNMVIRSNLLLDTLHFVPDTLRHLELSKLTGIEDSTIRYLYNDFPNLETLDLLGEFFLDAAILALDFNSTKLKSLSFGYVGSLTRACFKFQLDSKKFSNLRELKIQGCNGLADDGNRLPQLFGGTKYPYQNLTLSSMNMNVDYSFTAQRFPNLQILSLEYCHMIQVDHITQIITQLPQLVRLSLDYSNLTDLHFEPVSRRRKPHQLLTSPISDLSVQGVRGLGVFFLSTVLTQFNTLTCLDLTKTSPTHDHHSHHPHSHPHSHHHPTPPTTSFVEVLQDPGLPLAFLTTLNARDSLLDDACLKWVITNSPVLEHMELEHHLITQELNELACKVRPELQFTAVTDMLEETFSEDSCPVTRCMSHDL